MQYNDPLLRPTRVIPPNGGAVSEMIYNDTPGAMWVKTRTQVDGTNWKEAIAFADGLGRTIRTQSIDNQGDVFTEAVYDVMGRAYLSSNPYRNGETKYWTQTNFDVAGRAKEIITPDGAKVQTSYDVSTSGMIGTVVTVTDQANKQRRSITNALGQLMRVDEPDDNGNLGSVASPTQATNYSYDTLSNLVQVNQGVQQRNFSYNSLSRLLTATNPESGTINYSYDNNGNLTQKTDARGVVTNYVYDNLNRAISRIYNDGTPNVTYKYDNLTFAKGKLVQVASSISTTNYNNFDNLGRILNSQQITDGQTYNFGYSYNLSGALVNETYPSGRIITNNFEVDGDLAQVNGTFQGNNKTYVGNLSYTSAGAVSSLQLGNGRWENTTFNARLQPIQIGLGSSQNAQDLWKVNYDYGTTDNNGNVKSQQITVPSQFTAIQNYSYDSLNRLKSANETISGSQTWKQTFTFDRYGNRKFDASQTTTLGGCPVNVCNPDISMTDNRVVGHTFDNSGNTTIDAEGKTFFYDAENKQKEVRNAQNVVIGQYFYDGNGSRVKKIATNDTTVFVYDASNKLIVEIAPQIKENIYAGSRLLAEEESSGISYLTNDTLGSPRVITNANGVVVSTRDFRPYGEEIARPNQGTDKVRQKFTSYERDIETGDDFAQARYYNSKIGRFQSPDPLIINLNPTNPQGWNSYTYVLNSPTMLVDPTGLIWGRNNDGDVRWFKDLDELNATKGFVEFTPENGTYKSADGRWVTLNPDGPGSCDSHYDCSMQYFTSGWVWSSDPSTWIDDRPNEDVSLDFYLMIFSGGKLIKNGGEALIETIANQASKRAVQTFAGGVTRTMLETATKDSGSTIKVVTKLGQSPQLGKQLYVWEEAAEGVANQAIQGGQVFSAKIPKVLIETLRTAGLVRNEMTLMNGVQHNALVFRPEAAEFIVGFFK